MEIKSLTPQFASDDVGRGGDGRKLDPKDNGGPDMIDVGPADIRLYAALGIMIGMGGAFFVKKDAILHYLNENNFTPEQFVEKLLEMLQG